jgi:hypothetical protein
MAYNFKSIADVEVVAEPAESANVLIEEDGVIKKAPKTAVGGGSSSSDEFDVVIEITKNPWRAELADVSVIEGSLQNVIDASYERIPKVKLLYRCFRSSNSDAYTGEFTNAVVVSYGGDYNIQFNVWDYAFSLQFNEYSSENNEFTSLSIGIYGRTNVN